MLKLIKNTLFNKHGVCYIDSILKVKIKVLKIGWKNMVKKINKEQNSFTFKFFIDPVGNTFSMWFDNPKKEYVCEMNEREDILSLDKKSRVIGFEKLNFLPQEFVKSLMTLMPSRIKGNLLLLTSKD